MPTLPQGRLLVLSFSLILSCVVFGVSIGLFFAPKPQDFFPYPKDDDTWLDWRRVHELSFGSRDYGPPPDDYDDDIGFRVVPILGLVASSLNFLILAPLLIVPIMKPKTVIPAVAIEASCIYFVSFLWLATGAYAEHSLESGTNCFPVPSVGPYCTEHKVLESISFINWIQLMLYANTLMTVATICHVRKHRVWTRPVSELPTFAAPALTFGPQLDSDSPSMAKINESALPLLGDSTQPTDSRASLQFRSRIMFPTHTPARPGIPLRTSSSLPLPQSESTTSLAPAAATRPDVATHQNATSYPRLDTGHCLPSTGEPPMYSGPGSTYELITV